ncbi:hypothetical protein [Labilithrix luteola]|uniref:hypothetical protein n=1 Tax=Labilithrix luteola TaxID=1391654 RepID=UPI0011BA7D9A|nr:hypothetical protein [Labilithrix luteola]
MSVFSSVLFAAACATAAARRDSVTEGSVVEVVLVSAGRGDAGPRVGTRAGAADGDRGDGAGDGENTGGGEIFVKASVSPVSSGPGMRLGTFKTVGVGTTSCAAAGAGFAGAGFAGAGAGAGFAAGASFAAAAGFAAGAGFAAIAPGPDFAAIAAGPGLAATTGAATGAAGAAGTGAAGAAEAPGLGIRGGAPVSLGLGGIVGLAFSAGFVPVEPRGGAAGALVPSDLPVLPDIETRTRGEQESHHARFQVY